VSPLGITGVCKLRNGADLPTHHRFASGFANHRRSPEKHRRHNNHSRPVGATRHRRARSLGTAASVISGRLTENPLRPFPFHSKKEGENPLPLQQYRQFATLLPLLLLPSVLACTIEPRALQLASAGTGGRRARLLRPVKRTLRARAAPHGSIGRNARRARWIGRPAPHMGARGRIVGRGAQGAGRPRGRRPRRAPSLPPFCSVHGQPGGGCLRLRLRALCRTYVRVPFLVEHAQGPERAEPVARR